ncbi:hypothetical protein C8F01DRAFT_1228848 [Mycena amicta]|nr:hypothetical protein C8F01DRAFT_1228848 [Mycena amicta]
MNSVDGRWKEDLEEEQHKITNSTSKVEVQQRTIVLQDTGDSEEVLKNSDQGQRMFTTKSGHVWVALEGVWAAPEGFPTFLETALVERERIEEGMSRATECGTVCAPHLTEHRGVVKGPSMTCLWLWLSSIGNQDSVGAISVLDPLRPMDLAGRVPRPNSQPVAIGNSTTTDYLSVDNGSDAPTNDHNPAQPEPDEDDEEDKDDGASDHESSKVSSSKTSMLKASLLSLSDDDSSSDAPTVPTKHKRNAPWPLEHAPTRKPAAATSTAKKAKGLDLGSMVDQEQETQRGQLELATIEAVTDQTRAEALKAAIEGRAKERVRKEKRKAEEAAFSCKMQLLAAVKEHGLDTVRVMFLEAFPSDSGHAASAGSSPGPSHHSSFDYASTSSGGHYYPGISGNESEYQYTSPTYGPTGM